MPLLAPRTAMRIGLCLRRAPAMGQSREPVEGSWPPCRRGQCRLLISKVVLGVPGVIEGKMDGQGDPDRGPGGIGRFLKVLAVSSSVPGTTYQYYPNRPTPLRVPLVPSVPLTVNSPEAESG